MLKEVGASGQISLGKKYAGQLFDVQFIEDGRVELTPVKVVPAVQERPAGYTEGNDWPTPEHMVRRKTGAARTPRGWNKRAPDGKIRTRKPSRP